MTKTEFIQMQKLAARRETRRLAVWVGVGWVTIIALLVFGREFQNGSRFEELMESLATTQRHLLLVGWGVLALLLALAISAVRPPQAVPCPHCRRSLFGLNARIAMLTRNCGFCGERVIT